MAKSKSKSKRRVGRPRKSRKTSLKYISKDEKDLGNCRGKKKSVCSSDPNCSYRKKIGCVKKRGSKGASLKYGPTLPNAKYKRKVGRPSGKKSRKSKSKSQSKRSVGRPRKSRKSKSKSRSKRRVGRPRKSRKSKSKSRSKRRVGRPRKSRRDNDGCGDDWGDDGCGDDWDSGCGSKW